jgi:sn-glycerol 3-phosphate transport system permease protein
MPKRAAPREASSRTVGVGSPRRLSLRWREALTGLLLIAPALIGLGVFVYRPLLDTFWLSFQDWNMVRPTRTPVGLANYQELAVSPTIRVALRNTLAYGGWLLGLIIVLPLVVSAGLTYLGGRTRQVFTAVMFTPMVVSLGIAAVLWLWVYNPLSGFSGNLSRALGIAPMNWLSNPATVLGAIAVIVAWKAFGYNMLLFISGFGTISRELIDAARVDGAAGFRLWRFVVLPLLAPTTVFVILSTLAMAAEYVFTPIHVLTGGGPVNASTNIVFEIYRQAFRFFRVGYASSVAIVVFLLFLIVTVVQMRISEKIVSYEER